MFKSTKAKTPEEYIALLSEPQKNNIKQLHEFIKKIIPQHEQYIVSGMIGYGTYHYKYASGREGDWCLIGLAQQKNYISVYVCAVADGMYVAEKYKDKLPKANIGKSCIRFKKIEDVDLEILRRLILEGVSAAENQSR